MSDTSTNPFQNHKYLEILVVLLVVSISLLILRHSAQDPMLLHLYYVPVVLTGFYLGGYRARVASFLCIVTAFSLFVPSLSEITSKGIPLETFMAFSIWSGTLLLVAVLTGSLSDGLRNAMKERETCLRKDALTDSLTGVPNRRAFNEEITYRISQERETDDELALILVDIDYFKTFNDRYGHQTGDAVLTQVAAVFQKVIRSSDLLARYGGEEFALVLPNISHQDALEIAERSRSLIEAHRFEFQGLAHRLTVSAGVAFANEVDTEETFCERADAALYSSKAAGRNCIHHHDGSSCHTYGNGFRSQMLPNIEHNEMNAKFNLFSTESAGLPTQLVFLEELRRRVLEKQRYGVCVSIALVEYDDLPDQIHSDAHMGQSVSANTARLISSSMRDSDFVAHWSDGTFAILMPSTSLEQALVPVARLTDVAKEYSDPQYPSLSYQLSAGIVEVGFSEHYADVVQRASSMLSKAKASEESTLFYHDGLTAMNIPCDAGALIDEQASPFH